MGGDGVGFLAVRGGFDGDWRGAVLVAVDLGDGGGAGVSDTGFGSDGRAGWAAFRRPLGGAEAGVIDQHDLGRALAAGWAAEAAGVIQQAGVGRELAESISRGWWTVRQRHRMSSHQPTMSPMVNCSTLKRGSLGVWGDH